MTSRGFRRIAIGVGVLVVLLVVAAVVLVATFDANRYKALAIDWMKTEHQRTLAIDGPIELSLFPRLALKVSKVRLSERGRSDEFAAIDEASFAVKVLPLLHKEVVVGRVAARGVRAAYLRDAKGARNIDDLVSAGPAPSAAASAPPPSGAAAARFDVGAIQLEDLRLRVRDDMATLAGEVDVQSLTSGHLANRAEAPVSLRATVKLTQPQAAAVKLDGRTTLALDLDRNAVALSDMKLDVEGEGAGVKALSLALEGALAWDGKALRAGPLQLAVKGATAGAISVAPSTLSLKRVLFDPDAQRLELEALKLALAGRQGDAPFQVALDWPQLAVGADRLQGSALAGRVKLSGPTALEGEFHSGAPTGTFKTLGVPALQLKLAGSSGPRKIDADAQADVVVDLSRKAASIERLDVRATLADPGLQPLKLAMQGTAAADPKAARWKLNGSINANRFESSGQAALGGAVPEVKASARFDSLDVNTLLARDKAAPPPKTAATAPADTPVSLDGLKAVNGQFTLEANALVFRQYRVADAKVAATLDKGLLRVTRLAGRAWGGSFEGSGSADASSHRVAAKLDANGVNVNALLKDVADKDLLEGTGHVVADLRSTGATVGALRSALAGTAALQLRDGAIKGINLARLFRLALAELSLKLDAVMRACGVEKTDFSELRASARIADGVATSDDLDVKSPFLRINGAGRFDIGRGRVDYIARVAVIDSAAGQGGAGLDALRGVTVPVELTGPFDAIDWKIQWSGVAAAAVQNKLKEKLGEALGAKLGVPPAPSGTAPAAPAKPKDVLRDTLKGLFK
jgi:AsmA protein